MHGGNEDREDRINWSVRKRHAEERGAAEYSWLHARFTFSFAEYFDPDHIRFHSLVVMNNDVIEPGGGFQTHPHKDAEIFTYVMSGQLEHKDSMGNGAIIEAGNLQYISAGSGVLHSEFNPSQNSQTELYQIWLHPKQTGGEPRYAEKKLGEAAKENALTLLFAGKEKDYAIVIRQDAEISFGKLDEGRSLEVPASEHSHAWVQVMNGELELLGETLKRADGLAISNHPDAFTINASQAASFLLFRLS